MKLEKQESNPDKEDMQEGTKAEKTFLESLETMTERGAFEANGYRFDVKPIELHEVNEYLNDKVFVPNLEDENGDPVSDKELGRFMMRCFILDDEEEQPPEEKVSSGFFGRKSKKAEIDYSKYPMAKSAVKWIEKKVSMNGSPVKFQELETKYQLSKAEIAKLVAYLSRFSGF